MPISGYRHEYKQRINMSDLIVLTGRLGYIAAPDGHMKNGPYFVRSLYFDNYCDKALREKIDGINIREKFRIRYYDMDSSFIRLEKKSKKNGLCMKNSVQITREQTEEIISGNYDLLAEADEPLLKEFYIKLCSEQLRPKLIVDYRRRAYVYPYGNVRVTFDNEISSSGDVNGFFTARDGSLPVPEEIIMEIKYDEFLPQVIADITRLPARQSSAFSKYAAGRYI